MIKKISSYILEDEDDLLIWYYSWFAKDDKGKPVFSKLSKDLLDVTVQLTSDLGDGHGVRISGGKYCKHWDTPVQIDFLNASVKEAIKACLLDYAERRADELILESRAAMGEGRED
jgi:hypothetical protein